MMKKTIACLYFSAFAVSAFAQQAPVGIALTLDIDVGRINFGDLTYHEAVAVTNRSYEWVEGVAVVTNLYYGMKPDEVVTNSVRRQVETMAVELRPAHWKTEFSYVIEAGRLLEIGGSLRAKPKRQAELNVELTLTDEQMVAIVGSGLAGQGRLAAQTFGALPVNGSLKTALQGAVFAVLSGGE